MAKVAYAMFEKWRRDFDREFKTVSWLECESAVEGEQNSSVLCAVSFDLV